MENKITIGLNMIMKNESKVLPRLLESIYPVLDWYTVVDTGSTDNSKEIVKDFFDSKGIKGEIHDHEWVNHSEARNFAIEKMRGKADYAFWINAGDNVILKRDFNINKFKMGISGFDWINVLANNGNIRYDRPNIFNMSKPFQWKHPVHEILYCDGKISDLRVKTIETKINNDGNTWTSLTQKEKYSGHAEMLLKEVEKTNHPRDVFYLAQSYRDSDQNEKALEWYKKRVEMTNGIYEEIYYSQYMVGKMTYRLIKKKGQLPEVAKEMLKCDEIDDLRAEHWFYLYHMYIDNKRESYAEIVKQELKRFKGKNPYPKRQLFIEPDAYKG